MANDLSPPNFLTAITDQNAKVPLFWFSPHPETLELAYHADVMLDGMFTPLPWHENCVSVRMKSPSSPFYFLKSRVYISHRGPDGEPDYNFQEPFLVTVNGDSEGFPQNGFLDSDSAKATGEDSLAEGEWVEIEHNLLMEDTIFWIVFHWREESPASPLIGEDTPTNVGNSFWGKRSFFHFEWHPCYHNLMIRAQVVTNSELPSEVDSFKIYRSPDSANIMDQSNLIASVSGLQFRYTDWEVVEDQTYFYQVTAFASPEESQGSDTAQATPKRQAELFTDKDELLVHLNSGQQILEDLTLSNFGGLPLGFKVQINMVEVDWMGGSDSFGYAWMDNDRQLELAFTWVDIEDRGIQIGQVGDNDEDYGFFHLGFSFPFYGSIYDSIRIASDGWFSFSPLIPCYTDTFKCYSNKCLPYLWGPYNLLAPFWDDLKLTDSSRIYFYANSDSAIISFLNLYHFGSSIKGPYTFQTILTPDGEIVFQYLYIDDSLYSATVGIQNHNGTKGLGVFCNQNDLHDSLAIKIRPSWIRLDSMEGYIPPGESRTLNLTFDPLSYPRGIYHADLLIDSWDKNHQLETLIIPLTLCLDTTLDTTTSVGWTDSGKPESIMLFQNFPNPFNPLTSIQYSVVSSQSSALSPHRTTLKIYNVLGQLVKTLVKEEKMPGNYKVIWDGKDDRGKEVASGIYFCKLTVGSYQEIRKMVLLK